MKKIFKLSTVALVAVLIAGCSSASLISSWSSSNYTPQSYSKILVFAVTAKVNNRAIVETAMASEFAKSGIMAVSSLYMFPTSGSLSPEQVKAIPKEELAQKLKDNGIDGLLVLSLLDKKDEQVYVQGTTYTQPTTIYHPGGYYNNFYPYYNNYYSYYSTVYTTVTTPGYYENQTSFFLESNFYRVSDGSLVWSAQTKAVDPPGISEGAADWAYAVVKEMKAKKIFAQ